MSSAASNSASISNSCASSNLKPSFPKNLIPLSLKHIYSGTISIYFYACFPQQVIGKWLNYSDDVFYELFDLPKYEFLQTYIVDKRYKILTSNKLKLLIEKLEKYMNKYF